MSPLGFRSSAGVPRSRARKSAFQNTPREPARCPPAEEPWTQAGAEDLCFLELQDPAPALARADRLVVYRWNRHYPSDRKLLLPPEGWTLTSRTEFPGHSHDVITKEIYQR